jgi:hypothetical protein
VIRGLILDKKLGNLVKVDRFGFVKRAMHGTRMLNAREMYQVYGRDLVKYADSSRWKFVNTLFSVSEAVMYSQLVDRLDSGYLPEYVVGRSYTVRPSTICCERVITHTQTHTHTHTHNYNHI